MNLCTETSEKVSKLETLSDCSLQLVQSVGVKWQRQYCEQECPHPQPFSNPPFLCVRVYPHRSEDKHNHASHQTEYETANEDSD
jgi:hypothetical protein